MRLRLLLLLLLASAARAGPPLTNNAPSFTNNVLFEFGPLRARLLNWELPRGKPYLIVHFEISNPGDNEERCDWRSLISLVRSDGTTMAPNYDALVDSGGGLTRATGPFTVPKRKRVKASLLFILGAGDLPGSLRLPDGRESTPIESRGKTSKLGV